MADCLPLSAFRQGLLPEVCRSCDWWQSTGNESPSPEAAAERRRQWMISAEESWGTTGILLDDSARTDHRQEPVIVGCIGFAPAAAVPRIRELPFNSLTAGSALLFCLWLDEGQPRSRARRLLHKALAELRSRGVSEAFAIAGEVEETGDAAYWEGHRCGLFSAELLEGSGFESVMESGRLVLMRVDLRGLLMVLGQLETAVKRVLHHEPTPSPATWTQRGS